MPVTFSVFTKPWRMPLAELGEHVAGLGFGAIELPVRPGYPVEPENVARGLPEAARILARSGVHITSVAGPTDEPTVMACGEAGVPVIRTMARIGPAGYLASVEALQAEYAALVPALERAGVTIGVQNHCDRFVTNALGLRDLLAPFDARHVAAVWDAAHEALNGMEPDMALDIIWPKLCMVNLKNAFWQRTNGPEAEAAVWRPYWTAGHHGLASWPRVVAELWRRGYSGTVCLTAEYSDEPAVDRLIVEDLAYARSLFA
jgi:sugar phosphate isomerase/epimerase